MLTTQKLDSQINLKPTIFTQNNITPNDIYNGVTQNMTSDSDSFRVDGITPFNGHPS